MVSSHRGVQAGGPHGDRGDCGQKEARPCAIAIRPTAGDHRSALSAKLRRLSPSVVGWGLFPGRHDASAWLRRGHCVCGERSRGAGPGPALEVQRGVCARHWLVSADRRRCQRSCTDEPVHGSTGSLLPGMSTLWIPQVATVHTTAGGNHTKAQRRPQKFLDVGRCPIMTLSGPALAALGHQSPGAGRASAFKTALVTLGWNADSRGRHSDGSWATHLPKSAGHDTAGDHSTEMTQLPRSCTTRGGATATHVMHSRGFDPNWDRKASTCLARLP